MVCTLSLSQELHPSQNVACKTCNTSKMDCSHRNLVDIPVLDRNWTTVLDLSHNQLKEIHGAPFGNLSNLTSLDLSHNMISKLSSTVFKGLYSLVKLDLCDNELSVLSSDVFGELHELVYLEMSGNPTYDVSSQTLATLNSLQFLYISYIGNTLDTIINDFQNLARLKDLYIMINEFLDCQHD